MASSSSGGPSGPEAREVEAILSRMRDNASQPTDKDLVPVFNYVMRPSTSVSDGAASSSASSSGSTFGPEAHWYCSQAPSDLYRDAATYLIFMFAFKGVEWIKALERVVGTCASCARTFGAARRRFAQLYLSRFAIKTRAAFGQKIDSWQADFILKELEVCQPAYGAETATIVDLPPQYLQLLFNEPALLNNARISAALEDAISTAKDKVSATVSSLGLTPVLVNLLASSQERRRTWAHVQVEHVRPSLSFDEWSTGGVGTEVQGILFGDTDTHRRWSAVALLLGGNRIAVDTIQLGLLSGQYDLQPARPDRSIMVPIARLLGSPSDTFPLIFDAFTTLLRVSPTRHIWTFDSTPELPHTLFSDIKKNSAFRDMVLASKPSPMPEQGKGKMKETVGESPSALGWITSYLLSVNDVQARDGNSGFSEALARVMSFCFSEAQNEPFESPARAAAAQAGFFTLLALQNVIDSSKPSSSALVSTIEVHASFIASTAFADSNDENWQLVRRASQQALSEILRSDGKDVIERVLFLGRIAVNERRRVQRRKKMAVPDATRVDKLARLVFHGDLWISAFNSLSGKDAAGLTLLMQATAQFSHIEQLDRHTGWNAKELTEVVNEEDWIMNIRFINANLKASREGFPQALETFAAQPDPAAKNKLWEQQGAVKAVIMLLLSPVPTIHDPVINLVQQAFPEVDDRGDCFRALLENYPIPAMDGLLAFLSAAIQTANVVPEACSLAKWIVRCFTDVLDALCQPAGESPPLLQSDAFLSTYADNQWMTRRVGTLWQLMTDTLALIFKRTVSWAPFYDNDVMVDWMRDALIFGRTLTDHIRTFESAVLNRTRAASEEPTESPVRMSMVGKRLVDKLKVVLADLVGWLRLTDLETLHQAFELIKTILNRISKSQPDLSQDPQLEKTLLELEKFSRRANKAYNCRLSDDLLSELTELLDSFDLPISAEDEIQFVKEVKNEDVETVADKLKQASIIKSSSSSPASTPAPPSTAKPAEPSKNAFAIMMKKAGGSYTPSPVTTPKPVKPAKPRQRTLDEFENDDTLDNLSAQDLDILERRAVSTTQHKQSRANVVTGKPKEKLLINVVPKYEPPARTSTSSFKSKFMRDIAAEHRMQRRAGAPMFSVPAKPVAPIGGSGLGAYTGPKKEAAKPKPADSGSSASESSSDEDDENKGISALIKPKVPIKPAVPERFKIQPRQHVRPVRAPVPDIFREREERRRRNQRLRPNITQLFQIVLSWDPNHQGPRPPFQPKDYELYSKLQPVPTSFRSVEEYERIMLPLFLQELWAQFTKGDAPQAPVMVEVAARAYEDDFLDIDVNALGTLRPDFSVNESDIVIINIDGVSSQPLFAKVQGFRRMHKGSAIKLRILAKMDQRGMGVKAKMQLRKHISLSTALREFTALKGFPYYEDKLQNEVLTAKSAAMPDILPHQIEDAMRNFNVNEPQAKAIVGSMSVKGFSLIQGPPGTGKTKTISGLVGKFLSERKAFVKPAQGEAPPKAKLLVCAPSNAAIDEVCKRLMDGVPSSTGGRFKDLNIVRIGIESSVNVAVKDVCLDNIVERKVTSEAAPRGGDGSDLAKIQKELDDVKEIIKDRQEQLQRVAGNDERRRALEQELHSLNSKRTKLGQASSKAKDAARDATRHLDGARRAAKDAVLKEADIICATLSGAGQEVLAPYTFETVIIDEAAQAIEMSCLIPLKYGCQRCIMVGDPNQLPPTTFSQEAEQNKFNQSLFVRMAQQKDSFMHLLSIQYRMHPEISVLPSKVFYDSRLEDGPDMHTKTVAVWHKKPIFGPYHFINVNGVESKAGMSTKNTEEAQVAVDLYRNLKQQFGSRVNLEMRVGVITMYREQLNELKRRFQDAFGRQILDTIDFNTVDGFQGQEKDIIILSCVRSGPNLSSIGFLRDFRRMNVALTRAKSSLFVIGNAATLERSDDKWRTIIGDARNRGLLIDYTRNVFSTNAPPPKRVLPPPQPAAADRPQNNYTNGASKLPQNPPHGVKRKPTNEPADRAPKAIKRDSSPVSTSSAMRSSSPATGPPPPPPTSRPPPPPPPEVLPAIPGLHSGNSRSSSPSVNHGAGPPRSGLPPMPAAHGGGGPGPSRPIPPKPAARAAEDVLFTKKKKPNRPPTRAPGNVRAAINNHLARK